MWVRFYLTLLFLLFFGVRAPAELLMPEEKEILGKAVPNVRLVDSSGRGLSLKEIIGGKPLILSLIYTRCPMACLLITDSLLEVVEKIGGLGDNFNVLTLSFDPTDTPKRLETFMRSWSLDRKGWIVAGGDEKELTKLLTAIDFHYILDKATGEFLHPNLLIILTPDGRISRYIYGALYRERDVRLSLLNAKKGSSTLSVAEGFLLRCFRFDPVTRTYDTDWAFLMHIFGGVSFFLSVFIVLWGRKFLSFFQRLYSSLQQL